jgi:hypothetical protein
MVANREIQDGVQDGRQKHENYYLLLLFKFWSLKLLHLFSYCIPVSDIYQNAV